MIKTFLAGALSTATAIALALPASAQTIDYGSLEQLFGEPVTTSATGKPQRASDAPVNMEIITAEEIRRTGAANIPDILQRVIGVDFMRWGAASADVAIRGYNGPRTPRLLVLVNGRQVYLDHYGTAPWSSIPVQLSEIRQIEVVKGPNTALFGFNAVGGVVNIITYSPLYDSANNVTVRAGTQNYREVSGVTTLKLSDKLGVRLSAGGYNTEEFDTVERAVQPSYRFDPHRRTFSADALFQATPDIQIGAELTKGLSRQLDEGLTYSLIPTDTDTQSAKASVAANTVIGLLNAVVYRNVADVDLSTLFSYNNTVTVARAEDLFKIGTDHSFRVSAEFRRNEMKSTPNKGGKVSYDVYSAGGMWDWAISENWNLVNAVRVDHLRLGREGTFAGPAPFTNADYDRNLTEPSFNSGLVFKATDKDTFRLAVARGIQAPTLYELTYMSAGALGNTYGNPNINPSIVTNYELGYERTIAEIDGALETSLYHQQNKDLKAYQRTVRLASPRVAVWDNIGDSTATGAELSLKGKVQSDWAWKIGYTFELVNDDFENQTTLNFEDSTPRHKVNAQLGYTNGPWEANVFGQYISGIDMLPVRANSLVEVPASFTLAARVGYQITEGIQVAATGFNITQSEQRLTSGPAEERRVLFSISAQF
jgi:iron complex outermembrane receptor protein